MDLGDFRIYCSIWGPSGWIRSESEWVERRVVEDFGENSTT